ncbi:DNA topoisomerase 3 [Acidithiobacillus sp. IBUN Pt1247-S3]|uniref:DNA topoisomerase 3 n=1 Tax=Acidithiobacillus sp. IBUN Pt1247-S3 TaxID=3166642 RepID=UPI0034E37684
MRLVIAEKPSLAKAIAEGVAADPRRGPEGSWVSGGYTITYAVGHILEQAEPDEYLPKRVDENGKEQKGWRWEDLPIFPQDWKKHPVGKVKEQLSKIGKLLRQATLVVHAGDPDREGQIIIDEILQHFGYTGKVERVWLASMDGESVRKAFANLRDNGEYHLLSQAAEARSRADWLVGMNLTRAWSLRNYHTLSVGRVQTPTLSLVVRRDREIEQFRPQDFYAVEGLGEKDAWKAVWQAPDALRETPSFDAEGRLVDPALAEKTVQQAGRDLHLQVERFENQEKSQAAPLPYNLSSLQKAASARFGFSAKQVLDIAQALYEKKMTSYPRTDCRYLPEEQLGDAQRVLDSLKKQGRIPDIAQSRLLPQQKHVAWNTGKVTAHHAIAPTGAQASLSPDEGKVYDLVVQSYLGLFLPSFQYQAQSAVLRHREVDGVWKASGRKVREEGWKVLHGAGSDAAEDEEDTAGSLPDWKAGMQVPVSRFALRAQQTRPPSRFTDGTLIEAMSQVHRFVTDERMRALLKENAGIGTEATRAAIVEKLLEQQYLQRKGKQLISTPMGRSLIDRMSPDLSDPVTTARWEEILNQIAQGKISLEDFEKGIRVFVKKQLGVVRDDVFPDQRVEPCPLCADSFRVRRLESQKNRGKFYWRCDNPEEKHGLLSDREGHPGQPFGDSPATPGIAGDGPACPKCSAATLRKFTKNDHPYFSCQKCRKNWWADRENPEKLGALWSDKK